MYSIVHDQATICGKLITLSLWERAMVRESPWAVGVGFDLFPSADLPIIPDGGPGGLLEQNLSADHEQL